MLHTHLSALKYCHNHPDTLFNNHRISASLLTKHIRWHKCVNAMRKCKHASDTAKKTHTRLTVKTGDGGLYTNSPRAQKNTHLHLSKRLVQPDMIYWQASVNGPSEATNQLPTDARTHSVVCAYHNIINRCVPPLTMDAVALQQHQQQHNGDPAFTWLNSIAFPLSHYIMLMQKWCITASASLHNNGSIQRVSLQRLSITHTYSLSHRGSVRPSVRPFGCCSAVANAMRCDALPLTPATEMKCARARKGASERRASAERHTHLRPAPFGRGKTRPLLAYHQPICNIII